MLWAVLRSSVKAVTLFWWLCTRHSLLCVNFLHPSNGVLTHWVPLVIQWRTFKSLCPQKIFTEATLLTSAGLISLDVPPESTSARRDVLTFGGALPGSGHSWSTSAANGAAVSRMDVFTTNIVKERPSRMHFAQLGCCSPSRECAALQWYVLLVPLQHNSSIRSRSYWWLHHVFWKYFPGTWKIHLFLSLFCLQFTTAAMLFLTMEWMHWWSSCSGVWFFFSKLTQWSLIFFKAFQLVTAPINCRKQFNCVIAKNLIKLPFLSITFKNKKTATQNKSSWRTGETASFEILFIIDLGGCKILFYDFTLLAKYTQNLFAKLNFVAWFSVSCFLLITPFASSPQAQEDFW